MRTIQTICDKCHKEVNSNAIWSVTLAFDSSLVKLKEQLHFCTFEEMGEFLYERLPQTLAGLTEKQY